MKHLLLAGLLASTLAGCVSVVYSTPYKGYAGEPRPLNEIARVMPLLQGQGGGRLNLHTVDGVNAKDPKSGMPPAEVQLLPGKHTIGGGIFFAGCTSAVTVELDAKAGAIYYLNFIHEQSAAPELVVKQDLGGVVTELSRRSLGKECPTIYLQF